MDTQLKQRLTGAVILVLVGALLVPELLTGPKSREPASGGGTPPVAGSEEIGAGPGLRSYDITISQDGSGTAPAVVPEAPATVAPPATDAGPAASAMPREPVEPAPVVQEPVARPPAAQQPEPQKPAAQKPPAQKPPAQKPPAQKPPAQRAEPPKPGAQTSGGGYVVQLGSFASRASADRLAGELRRRGFQGGVAPVQASGRTLYRVRVGPAADRGAASALAARLKSAGYSGTVVPSG